jgi:hypothetical protein
LKAPLKNVKCLLHRRWQQYTSHYHNLENSELALKQIGSERKEAASSHEAAC